MRKFIFMLTILVVLSLCGHSSAEIKTFHVESEYFMSKDKPILLAQEKVFKDAIRMISEEAGVIFEGLSNAKNNNLQLDRMETFTAAILRIKSKTFGKEIISDGGLTITVKVDAELDTDEAAEILNEMREAKKSAKGYEEVLKDYTKRKKNLDTVYGEYLGSYQKRILRKIRDGCKLQSDEKFGEALKLYDEAIEEAVANNAEISLAYIKRGQIYNIQGKKNLATVDFEKALALNNDVVGIRYVKAVISETRGNNIQAAQDYRAFVKEADIVYYDTEIIDALNRIIELEEEN